jgi:uncharacterized protein YndB with AHSA1/START domain
MGAGRSAAAVTSDREIVITRVFDAPRELIWKAWTDPKHVVKWWGPRGFTTTIHEIDIRPGGVMRYTMHGPDGTDYPNEKEFIEVVRPERIVYMHRGAKDGDAGAEFQSTWTFEAEGAKTRVTMRGVFATVAARDRVVQEFGVLEGGRQTLERLEEQLAAMVAENEFVITRTFAASRDLVFKAWTEPDRLAKWWGPAGFKMRVMTLDLRPGGVFLYSMEGPPGGPMSGEVWGKFVYREIAAPRRLIFINSFADSAGNLKRHPMSATWPLEVLSTLTFEEHDGQTTVTLRGVPIHASDEERSTFEGGRSSMQQGFKGTLDQLADYLAKS